MNLGLTVRPSGFARGKGWRWRGMILAVTFIAVLLSIGASSWLTSSVNAAVPVITNISPNHGPIAGGTVITVTGTGFKGQYEQVEALVFDGASYIDTGVSQMGHGINVRFNLNTANTGTANMVFGNSDAGGASMYNFGRAAGSSGAYTAYAGGGTSTGGSAMIRVDDRNDVTLNWTRIYNVNGSQIATFGAAPTTPGNIWIGGSASPAANFRGLFYRMRILTGVIPDYNFIPVRNVATGECGVIDTMSSSLNFYGNSGSGTIDCGTTIDGVFTLGEVMPGAVSPDAPVQVLIDGRPCTGINVVSNTELTCHTPSGLSLGKKNVEVYIDSVNNTTMFDGFEYALRLNSIYPKFGPVSGGNTIEIEGGVFSTPPEQYESVEGIVFDGFSWLETGFNQVGSTKISMEFRYGLTACSGFNMGLFGARDSGSGSSFVLWGCTSNNMRTDFNAATGGTRAISTMPPISSFKIVKDDTSTIIYNSNGTVNYTFPATGTGIIANTNPVQMLLGSLSHGGAFGTNGATTYRSFTGTIYNLQICKDPTNTVAVPPGTVYLHDNDLCGSNRVLVRDFRAARRDTDNAFGFYDMVTGEFVENAGFGTFTPSGTTLTNELEVPVEIEVTVGGQTCTNPQITTSTTVSCVVPPSNLPGNGEGRVTVEVFANGVQAIPSTLDASDYYYGTPMVVDTISPNRGPITGGQVVTINGNNFFQTGTVDASTYWQDVTVTIGGSVCNIADANAITNTTITCTTTSNPGGISDVFVDNDESQYLYGGAINPITGAITSGYLYEDILLALSPNTGPSSGATRVTITGNNFLQSGTTRVFFGGVAATNVTVVSATRIDATTPAHAPGAVDVVVLQDGYAATLRYDAPGAFTYYFQGQAGGVTPNKGYISGGDSVIINGSGFDIHAAATVTFGGVVATNVVVLSSTQIQVDTPAHAVGLVDVAVTQFGVMTTMHGAFTFINPMTIASISPDRGSVDGGTLVTIYGESFVPASTTAANSFLDLEVDFGGVPCVVASVSDFTDTMIRCTTGVHVGGVVDVTVSTAPDSNHTDTSYGAFDPSTGALTGGYLYIVFELTLSASSVDLDLSFSTLSDADNATVYVRTDNPVGYSLTIRADDGNASTDNDNWLKCSNIGSDAKFQSIASTGPLTDNTWGWSVGSAVPSSWDPVSTADTDIVPPVQHPTGPSQDGVAPDSYLLWYGVKANQEQLILPCKKYSANLLITATANII